MTPFFKGHGDSRDRPSPSRDAPPTSPSPAPWRWPCAPRAALAAPAAPSRRKPSRAASREPRAASREPRGTWHASDKRESPPFKAGRKAHSRFYSIPQLTQQQNVMVPTLLKLPQLVPQRPEASSTSCSRFERVEVRVRVPDFFFRMSI